VTQAEFDAASRTVSVTLKNIGNSAAGDFLVYFEINQLTAPDPAKPEAQYSKSVQGLGRGAEIAFGAIQLSDFSARPSIDLATLAHGELIISADAKNMVKECDETNNRQEATF
jgi:hypothetical protein